MSQYDFIYGSKVVAQCQAQINIHPSREQNENDNYLILLKKNPDFFAYFCKLKHVVTCYVREPPEEDLDNNILSKVGTNIDDKLVDRDRALTWSKTMGKIKPVSGKGHGKQQITFTAPTFCARYMGVIFDPDKYSYSSS
jgi:hypothetical protein